MQTNTSSSSGSLLRIIILIVGSVTFLLLFFANKTNLNTKPGPDTAGRTVVESAGIQDQLPPIQDPILAQEIVRAQNAPEEEKAPLLDSLTHTLEGNGRLDQAALLAHELALLAPTVPRKLKAGILSYEASQMPTISNDSLLFRAFSDQAMQNLESVTQEDETNEEALLYLGLTYVESRLQQNAMRGILTIRKVVEINPNNAEASFRLGLFSLQTGQTEKALSRFEKVLEVRPDDHIARLQYAYTLTQLGRNNEAKDALNDVIEKTGEPELIQQAQMLLSQLP
ncbi:MAG: tetratricopeptide repeat protein [Bacteroidota bacterium]